VAETRDVAATTVMDSPLIVGKELRARPAALWRRAFSWIIDAAVIALLATGYLALASLIVGIKPRNPHFSGIDAVMEQLHTWQSILIPGAVLAALLAVVYSAIFAILWNGRTPGRLVSGIRLVDRRGLPPTPIRATIRGILSIFSFAFFLGGFWLALFDRRGQTLHDKLTSTFVVRPV
jgi:uncharacterized RDD family membrane protein YckC